jgi:hypothetical protein
MRFHQEKPDYFDLHRKEHQGRPILISLAFLASIAVWAALIAAVSRIV